MPTPQNNTQRYFLLYADCVPVKGAARSALYDLTKNQMHFLPNSYYELLKLLKQKKIGEVVHMLGSDEDKNNFDIFIDFLVSNDLGTFVDNISLFPDLNTTWDHPAFVTNAIIDCGERLHEFGRIFMQLDELGCKYVQLRFYNEFTTVQIDEILRKSIDTSIVSIECIIKYSPIISEADVRALVANNKIISLLIAHSAPTDDLWLSEWNDDGMETGKILLIKQKITSCSNCGVINQKSLHVPNVAGFFENQLFNSCLNRKISVDVNGEIRTCPSAHTSFGNIANVTLKEAINHPDFLTLGNINKDQIKICQDCELRYACTDCRVYLADPGDPFSKPAKCNYNPYTTIWEN